MTTYAALWAQTNYSFLCGASHPNEIVETAYKKGLQAITICDQNGVYGAVRAHNAAKKLGIKVIIGSTLTMEDDSYLILLVKNKIGYQNLCRIITRMHQSRLSRFQNSKSKIENNPRCRWEDVLNHNTGMIALCGLDSKQIRKIDVKQNGTFQRFSQLRQSFGDSLYGLITRHLNPGDWDREICLRWLTSKLSIKTTCSNRILYHDPSRKILHDVLYCIKQGMTLGTAGRSLSPNAEHYILPPERYMSRFKGCEEEMQSTLGIADQCEFSLDQLRYEYPLECIPNGYNADTWLRHCCMIGAETRYGADISKQVMDQLNHELNLIKVLNYAGYFLTMWDIVKFCKHKNILCQGRGSAANSVVCYCIGVTAIDPVYMNLLFERFMSKERSDPPDIDLDIEHNRREEVIQYVYNKYGRAHAAMVAVVITYRPRSAIRDIGKALNIPMPLIERVAKGVHRYSGELSDLDSLIANYATHYDSDEKKYGNINEVLDTKKDVYDNSVSRNNHKNSVHEKNLEYWAMLVAQIQRFPRHLSIHPGGFLLGSDEIDKLVPIERATMENRTIIQWDKDDVECLGLFKVDLLGLGALHLVHRCFDLLSKHKCIDLSLATIPKDDSQTYDMICRADTIGVFQIESRAQMSMLPRLKPRTFYDLVIQISIVRPGPISGNMVHPYLRRRQGLEAITYPHPSLKPVLSKTLGIPLFQEQVIKLAMVAADYSPGEADQLRRDMAAWKKTGQIGKHKDRLISRMMNKGIEKDFAERIFAQIKGFGEYGFPESHAASFAIIAYATSWLKCHHPEVFATALLNSLPMGFYAPSTIIDDARRHGVSILPIDVRYSDWECTLERINDKDGLISFHPQSKSQQHSYLHKHAIRMGLSFIKGLDKKSAQRIVNFRVGKMSKYQSETCSDNLIADLMIPDRLIHAVRLTKRDADALWRAGAFDYYKNYPGGNDRRTGLWSVPQMVGQRHESLQSLLQKGGKDNDVEKHGYKYSQKQRAQLATLTAAERINWDYTFSRHSTHGHPMAHLRQSLAKLTELEKVDLSLVRSETNSCLRTFITSTELNTARNKQQITTMGLVICRQKPSTAKGVMFMTLEDEFGLINLIIADRIYQKYKTIIKQSTFLAICGQVQHKENVLHISVHNLWEINHTGTDELRSFSRDFH